MPLQRPLAESVIVLTGASSGIGTATAYELAGRGAAVVLAARNDLALRRVAERCREAGGRALPVPTDIADPAAVQRLAATATEEFGQVDGWVNNAAVSTYGLLDEIPAAELRRVVEVILLGTGYGMQTALPYLRAAGGGVIVNNASVLAEVTMPYQAAYNAAKHGVRALSASVRQELHAAGHDEVSVCTLLPASIDTPFFRGAANHTGRTLRPPPPVYPPELVARRIVGLLVRPRRQAYAGAAAAALARAWRVAPTATERILGAYGARVQFGPGPAPISSGTLFRSDSHGELIGGFHGRRSHTVRAAGAVGVAVGAIATLVRRQVHTGN